MTRAVQRFTLGCLVLIAVLGWVLAGNLYLDVRHTQAELGDKQADYERCVLTTVNASIQIERAQRAWDAFNAEYGHVLVPVHDMEDE